MKPDEAYDAYLKPRITLLLSTTWNLPNGKILDFL
jgi:hypothetical protein